MVTWTLFSKPKTLVKDINNGFYLDNNDNEKYDEENTDILLKDLKITDIQTSITIDDNNYKIFFIKEKDIPENLKNKKESSKTIQIDQKKYNKVIKLDLDSIRQYLEGENSDNAWINRAKGI